MTTVNQSELQTAVSVDELLALGSNPTLSDLLFYVRDGSQASENGKHRKVAGNTLRSLMALSNAAGSDAAVSMVANTEYDVEGSAFTASRTYLLPGNASKGDRIRINFASAHSTHALIMAGASGVTINGGSAASEWSRLIIAKEWAEFRATSATNYDVYNDGRAFESCEIFGVAATAYTAPAVVKFTLGGSANRGMALGTNEIIPRRAGLYQVVGANNFQVSGGTTRTLLTTFATAGTTNYVGGVTPTPRADKKTSGAMPANESYSVVCDVVVSDLSNAFALWYYVEATTGVNQYKTSQDERPSLSVRRVA